MMKKPSKAPGEYMVCLDDQSPKFPLVQVLPTIEASVNIDSKRTERIKLGFYLAKKKGLI